MVKETRIIISPIDVVDLLATCSLCEKEVAIPIDATFVPELKCVYCDRPGFKEAYNNLYNVQRALKALASTLRIEVRDTEEK